MIQLSTLRTLFAIRSWRSNILANHTNTSIYYHDTPHSRPIPQFARLSHNTTTTLSSHRRRANRKLVAMEVTDSENNLYTRMRLWEFADQYVIEPTDGNSGSSLSISRVDGSMKLIGELPHNSSTRATKIQIIFGLVGMLKLFAGVYVIVITERECVGSYMGHPIFKVSSLKILPCNHSLKNSPVELKKMETEISVLLNAAERTTGLYFSYDVNLSLSAQRLYELGNESRKFPLWRQADPRYIWNNYMLEALIDNKLDPYLLPVVQGNFQNFQAAIGKDIADVTLIARRCTRRNGTRMWRRGADGDGYVANFVESEQIVQINGFTGSFVQVRGSIPLLWEQIVDLTYKPKFEVVRPEEAPQVVKRHFLDLQKRYGAVLAVDLVNKHGSEGRLCEKYANAMQHIASDDIRYLHFDFHQICGHIHFERLSYLYDQIEGFLKKNRYFLLNENGEKVEEQLGVVRTNCIDCLDRTNVTQSMIARKLLESQLQCIGVFIADDTIGKYPHFDECFKIMWANHGDEISIQYSGTPALKGDFVRFGKRTMDGIVKDGCNALARYYLNNFRDGAKQDAIDLLHGHFIVSAKRDLTPQSQHHGFESIASLRLALALGLSCLLFAIMSLKQARSDFRHFFFSLFWACLSLGLAAFVRANGRIFCNRPRLNKSLR